MIGAGRRHVVVVGVGTCHRRDDAAGPLAAGRVAAGRVAAGRVAPGRVAADTEGSADIASVAEPLDLLGRWDGADLAVVVDAVCSGAQPGTIHVIELSPGGPEPNGTHRALAPPRATSTHGIGLAEVLRLAQAIGRAPERVVVIGVEGQDFGPGVGLSPAVSAALPKAVAAVLEVLGWAGSGRSPVARVAEG